MSDCLEILTNMCLATVCFPGCDINSEINLIFLIKILSYMTKKYDQKVKTKI